MLEVSGEDLISEKVGIEDREGSSIGAPGYDMVSGGLRHYFPDHLDEG